MADTDDLNRMRMARRKNRAESAFLTLPRINKTRNNNLWYAALAAEIVCLGALEVYWARNPTATKTKQNNATLSQQDELPTQQAS